MSKDIVFQYGASSSAFLQRAKDNLARFDMGEPESIFYAALELRFGIEARLNEYIQATIRIHEPETPKVSDYVATKLLRMLTRLLPDAEQPTGLIITSEQSGVSSAHKYTPVTSKLAAMHGQLGELLHYKFFQNNQQWYFKIPLNGKPHRSLVNYRSFLGEVADELAYATSGSLLTHPRFTALMEEAFAEER